MLWVILKRREKGNAAQRAPPGHGADSPFKWNGVSALGGGEDLCFQASEVLNYQMKTTASSTKSAAINTTDCF